MRRHGQTPEAVGINGGERFDPREKVGLKHFACTMGGSIVMPR